MDTNIVFKFNGKLVTTSLIVAQEMEREHKHVLEAIRKLMEDDPDLEDGVIFRPSSYKNSQNKSQPMYEINRDGFIMLIGHLSGKQAAIVRKKFIAMFNEMETSLTDIAFQLENGDLVSYAELKQVEDEALNVFNDHKYRHQAWQESKPNYNKLAGAKETDYNAGQALRNELLGTSHDKLILEARAYEKAHGLPEYTIKTEKNASTKRTQGEILVDINPPKLIGNATHDAYIADGELVTKAQKMKDHAELVAMAHKPALINSNKGKMPFNRNATINALHRSKHYFLKSATAFIDQTDKIANSK